MQPRFMLTDDAATYCGMGKTLFRELVAPNVPALKLYKPRGAGKLGTQQVLHYDRNDLDDWCDRFKAEQLGNVSELSTPQSTSHNKHREKRPESGEKPWAKKLPASSNVATSGTSTSNTGVSSFAAAVTRAKGARQNPC